MILTTIISLLTFTDQPVKKPINKMAFKLTIALALFAVIYAAQATPLTNLLGDLPLGGGQASSSTPASTDSSVSTTAASTSPLGGLDDLLNLIAPVLAILESLLAALKGATSGVGGI
ncbi:uncharacterized protein [Atheta coriaria]|uniref:uncharacterized protein n=1 Tax=Dalotia coriaria TaxID=877792 RepID=UPI0031F433A2